MFYHTKEMTVIEITPLNIAREKIIVGQRIEISILSVLNHGQAYIPQTVPLHDRSHVGSKTGKNAW